MMPILPNATKYPLEFSRRPCTWLAIPLISGILVGEYIGELKILAFYILLTVITLALARLPRRFILTILAIGLFGWINHQWHTRILSQNDLRLLIGNQPRIATIEGTVRSLPTSRATQTENGIRFQSQLVLDVRRIRFSQRWQAAEGQVLVRVRKALLPNLFQGLEATVSGAIKHPDPPKVPGAFNYRRHLRFQGIYYELQLNDWSKFHTQHDHSIEKPIPAKFQEWARNALTIGQPENNQATKLIWAMVLGWRTWLTGEVREPFMLSGTLHVFAISGLHIAMIAGMMTILARCLGIPRRMAGFLIIPSLWLYTAATGSPASAIRASTVSSVLLLGWILGRPPDTFNSLGAAVSLLLAFEPLQLFQPGFQLSFTVVLVLSLVYPRLSCLYQILFPDHSLVSPQTTTPLRRFGLRCGLKMWSALAVSASAWLGSLPLVAMYFNLWTPISLLANLALVPMAGITMASSFMALLTAPLFPSLATIANSSSWFWMCGMIWICENASQIPGAYFEVPGPSPSICFLYYVALGTWAIAETARTKVIVLGACISLAIGLIAIDLKKRGQQTTVTFLPIPNGDAIFIDAPGSRHDWMIDGGPDWCATRLLDPFLVNQPMTAQFRNHLLTHGDKQHIEILSTLIDQKPSRRIVISPMKFRSTFYRQLIETFQTEGHDIERLAAPNKIGRWEILYPHPHTNPSPADDASIVLLGDFNGIKMLLLSDLDRAVQKELLNDHPTLEVDLISLNLPNDLEPPNRYVLSQLNPQAIIVTGSDSLKGDRWVRALRDLFSPVQPKVFFTGTDGTVTLTISHSQAQIRTISGAKHELQNRSH
jgi:competence protein ComEC